MLSITLSKYSSCGQTHFSTALIRKATGHFNPGLSETWVLFLAAWKDQSERIKGDSLPQLKRQETEIGLQLIGTVKSMELNQGNLNHNRHVCG